jgi:adenylate kinase
MADLHLILLGPPGAGKGTQAARLRDDLGLSYLSTGDILRRHRAAGTALGRQATGYMTSGRLVPDEVYHEVTEPLVDYYEERGVLHSFNGTSAPHAVSERIRESLGLARARRFGRTPVDADLVPAPGAFGRS